MQLWQQLWQREDDEQPGVGWSFSCPQPARLQPGGPASMFCGRASTPASGAYPSCSSCCLHTSLARAKNVARSPEKKWVIHWGHECESQQLSWPSTNLLVIRRIKWVKEGGKLQKIVCYKQAKSGSRRWRTQSYSHSASCCGEHLWRQGNITGDLARQGRGPWLCWFVGKALTTAQWEVKHQPDSPVNPNPVFIYLHWNGKSSTLYDMCWHQLSCSAVMGCLTSIGTRDGQSQKTAMVRWAASSLSATTWTTGIRNRPKVLAKQMEGGLNFLSKLLSGSILHVKAALLILSIKASTPSKILRVA